MYNFHDQKLNYILLVMWTHQTHNKRSSLSKRETFLKHNLNHYYQWKSLSIKLKRIFLKLLSKTLPKSHNLSIKATVYYTWWTKSSKILINGGCMKLFNLLTDPNNPMFNKFNQQLKIKIKNQQKMILRKNQETNNKSQLINRLYKPHHLGSNQ